MESACLAALEFPAVLDAVAGNAFTPQGAEAVRALRLAAGRERIVESFAPVGEIMALLRRDESPPLGQAPDLRQVWDRLQRLGSLIEAEEWLGVRRFLQATAAVQRFFGDRRRECPVCSDRAGGLAPLPELAHAIDAAIDENGLVRDRASEELARIRRELRRSRARLQKEMESTLRSLSSAGALQGDYWTLRNGRNVIPVRSGQKGRAPGLVHAASQSGETLFVEPFPIIEASNSIADLSSREAEEIRRILIALGDEARPHCEDLVRNTETVTWLDCAAARARFARRFDLIIPAFAESGGGFAIRQARHPLLVVSPNVKPIPIELEFRPGQRALILTGPNAGGKTTTLKTLGILCLMAQSGIPVPARSDSLFPVFETVFANIGDEQSLAAGLSTFSAHLLSIQHILENARGGALVLLDELGTATDPIQGGALGAAVLDRLAEMGATVLVTTHLPELKRWAHDHPAARNAATRFDEAEGRPAFQVVYDIPGASEAFRVARQLGFPADIIAAAERRVPEDERAMASIIASMEEKEKRLAEELAEAARTRFALEAEIATAREQSARLREAERRQRQEALTDRKALLAETRAQIERRVANLETRKELDLARIELRHEEETVEVERNEVEAQAPQALRFADLALGMEVYIPALHDVGLVIRLNPKRKTAVVAARGAEIEMPARQLARAPKRAAAAAAAKRLRPPEPRIVRAHGGGAPKLELNLHGWRVEAALAEVDRFIDHAVIDRLDSVRLLVGYGAMRQAVEERLRAHPHVSTFHRGTDEEGGQAILFATIG